MAHHLIAWEGVGAAGSLGETLSPAGDPLVGVWNQAYVLPVGLNRLLALVTATISGGIYKLASSRLDPQQWIADAPGNTAYVDAIDVNYTSWLAQPWQLDAWSDVAIIRADGVAGRQAWAFLWLAAGDHIDHAGAPIIRARFTGTTVAGAINTWHLGAFAFDQRLEQGIYAVVGGVAYDPNAIAFRLVPAVEPLYRPGGVAGGLGGGGFLFDGVVADFQRAGGLGEWMRFDSDYLPAIELFTQASFGAPFEGVLDLVKLPPDGTTATEE